MLALPRLLWLVAWPLEILAAWLLTELAPVRVVAALAVHVVAAAVFGLSLVTFRDGKRNWAWSIVGATLSLLLFPVFGMLSMTVAFTLGQTVRQRSDETAEMLQEITDTDDRPRDAVARAQEMEVALLDELEIEPVVDVLREDDPELKRAAIEVITKQRGSGTVRLLIGLLHDPSNEARFFASIGLSRLEDEISQAILAAQRALAESPDAAAVREHLAQLYLDYATSGFLEGVTRDYYLEMARESFDEALPLSEDPDEVVRHLALVHMLLGNLAESALLLEDLVRKRPEDIELHLLRMEVIYQFGDFRELTIYAERALAHVPADEAEGRELLAWWAEAGQREALLAG